MTGKLILRLKDMIDCIDKIEQYMENISEEEFCENTEKQDSVIRRLEIIGEAAGKISGKFKNSHSYIPWAEVSGLRNVLIHEYPGVNLKVIWDIVRNDLPELKKQLKPLYEKEAAE